MNDLFSRIRNKALQATQGIASFVQSNPTPAGFINKNIVEPTVQRLQPQIQNVQNSVNRQLNTQRELQKQGISFGHSPVLGRAIATDIKPQIDSFASILNRVSPKITPLTDILNRATGLGVGDMAKTALEFSPIAPYSEPEQAYFRKIQSGNTQFTPEELKIAKTIDTQSMMDVAGSVSPLKSARNLTPILKRQQRALELSKTAPKTVSNPVPFSETTEGIEFTRKQTEKVMENTINKGYDPKLVERLTKEGYKPAWIDNILSKAKEPERLKTDPEYAYNYFKKSAEAEGIKPIKRISEILKTKNQTQADVVVQQKPTQTKTYSQRLVEAKTPEEITMLRQEADQVVNEMDNLFKTQGTSFEQVVSDLESGRKTEQTKILTDWLDSHKARAESDLNKVIETRENYFPHYSKERIDELLTNPPTPDTFGGILTDPGFAKERTGSLVDYEISPRALKAYQNDALRNAGLTESQKAELRVSQEIVEGYKNLSQGSVDVVGKIQQLPQTENVPKVVFDAPEKSVFQQAGSQFLRSVNDRARMAGEQFYKTFLEPFRMVEVQVNRFSKQLNSLTDAQLSARYRSETGRTSKDLSREDLIMRLVLEKNSELNSIAVEGFKEFVKNAEFKQPWLKNLANEIFDEYVGGGIKTSQLTDKILGAIRAQAGRGALGLNVASALNNIFEIKRAFSVVKTKHFVKGVSRVMAGENLVQKYGIDSVSSTALERVKGRNAIGKAIEIVDSGLFYMFDKAERFKDQIMLAGFEEQGIAKGLKGQDLTRFVIQKFDQFAIKYGKGNDIGLYKNPLIKTLFQFGQYPIKDLIIALEKTTGAVKGDRGDASYVAKYVFASVAQMMIFKAVLGKIGFGDQTNTPIDVISNISEGNVPMTPALKAIFGMTQNISDALSGNQLNEYDQDQRDKSITRSMAVASVPAVNQLYFKTGKTIENLNRGYQEKFGGSVANPVSTDPASVAKALLFGPSYDPKRMEYIKSLGSGSSGLTKEQSNVFKNLSKEEQEAYYDQSILENKNRSEMKSAKEAIENPRQSFFDRILNKEKEVTPKWNNLPKTAQEKKDYKELVNTSLEAGITVPEKVLKASLFDNKSAQSLFVEDRMSVYKALEKALNNESYTQSQKDEIIKASGATKEAVAYYLTATKDMDVKLQEIVPVIESMPARERLQFLAVGRMKLGGKQLLTSEMITYLYDNQLIGEKEKELLSNLKFDEGKNKFYTSLKFASGSKRRLTASQIKKLYSIPKIKFNKPSVRQTSSSDSKLIEDILLKKPNQRRSKKSI